MKLYISAVFPQVFLEFNDLSVMIKILKNYVFFNCTKNKNNFISYLLCLVSLVLPNITGRKTYILEDHIV